MSLTASYGGYKLPVNAAAVSSRSGVVRSESGRPVRRIVRADVRATLFGDTVKELSDAEDKIRAALERPNLDFKFADDTGFVTSTSILLRGALGVAVVDGPNFVEVQSPEYVAVRTVSFAVEGEYVIRGAERALIAWHDAISVVGNGGPVRKWRLPLTGRAVRQQTTEYSIVRCTHSGQAMGHLDYPDPPPPAFGRAYLVNEEEAVTRMTADAKMNGYVNFPISWNYRFEADRVLRANVRQPRM